MLRNSLLVKEFSYEDDATVEFSVDPLMYEKLGIKKQKKGMESVFDTDKIKEFQLKKDIEKIKKVRGTYQHRNNLYLKIRETDPYYRVIAQKKKLGRDAQFNELLPYTVDASWRATSQPFGEIAEKRYQEYIANLPKGPSLEEVEDKLQRRTDHQLYRKILTGVLEPTRAEIREREKKEAEAKEREELEAHVVDIHKADREKARIMKEEKYEELRKLPTMRQHTASMKGWHKGINYPYDFEKGFPIVDIDDTRVAAGSTIIPELRGYESFKPNTVYSSKKYTQGEKLAHKEYLKQLGQLNYDLAVAFLEENRIRLEAEARKQQELKDQAEKQRRRVGAATSNIRSMLTQVKLEAVKENFAFSAKSSKAVKDSDDDDDDDDSSSASESEEQSSRQEGTTSKKSGRPAVLSGRWSGKEVTAPTEGGSSAKSSRPASAALSGKKGGTSSKSGKKSGAVKRKRPLTCSERLFRMCASRSAVAPFDSLEAIAAAEDDEDSGYEGEEVDDEVEGNGRKIRRKAGSMREDLMKAHRAFIDSLRSVGKACSSALTRLRSSISSAYERYEDWRSGQFASEKVKQKNREIINMRRELEALEKELTRSTQPDKYLNSEIEAEKMPEMVDSKEFYEVLKMKKKQIKYQMKELKERNKKMTVRDKKTYAALERRLQAMEVAVKERRELDNIEVNRQERIKEYTAEYKAMLEAEIAKYKSTRRYKLMHWYTLWRARVKRERAEALAKKNAAFQLKRFNAEENQSLFELLVDLRVKEKELEQRASRWLARLICTKYEPPVREYGVDDLIMACTAGRYKDVLDIVTSPVYYVGPNEVNTDGVTATYATLMMILSNAVLEDDRNVELLMYSKWQRFKRKYLTLSKKQHVASQLEYCLQILLNQGGDVTYASQEPGKDGTTVLHNAAEMGGIEMINWLLDKGVDVNILTTKLKKTALMVAVEKNRLDIVMLLMKRGGMDFINHADVEGWNVLHYATLNASQELVKVLLICGAKTTMRNSQGRLPQEEAVHRGKVDINLLIMSHRSVIVDHLSRLEFLDEELYSRYTSHVTKGRSTDEYDEDEGGAAGAEQEEQKVDESEAFQSEGVSESQRVRVEEENRLVDRETPVETHIRHTFDDFQQSGAATSAAAASMAVGRGGGGGGDGKQKKKRKSSTPTAAAVR